MTPQKLDSQHGCSCDRRAGPGFHTHGWTTCLRSLAACIPVKLYGFTSRQCVEVGRTMYSSSVRQSSAMTSLTRGPSESILRADTLTLGTEP